MDEWDEEDGDELPDEGEPADTRTCPACGASVYENADVCPRCGEFLSDHATSDRRRPWWIVAAALLVIAAFVLHWVLGRR